MPAGTFMACKFSYADDSILANVHWLAKGSGVVLKSQLSDTSGQSMTMELLPSSSFNGVPIAPQ